MTEMEQQHARLVGVLLSCAKNLQAFKKSVDLGDAEAGASKAVELIACLHRLYGGDGYALERDSLALAGRLGFNVQQMHVSAHSGVSH